MGNLLTLVLRSHSFCHKPTSLPPGHVVGQDWDAANQRFALQTASLFSSVEMEQWRLKVDSTCCFLLPGWFM